MKKLFLFITTVSLMLIFNLSSVSAEGTNFYLGAGYGASDSDTEISGLTGTASLDEEDSGFKLFAGYQFNEYIGIEIGYTDLGEIELKGNNGDTFSLDGITYTFSANSTTVSVETYVIPISAVLSLPLEKISGLDYLKYITPFAKLGGFYWEQEAEVASSALNRTYADEDGFDFFFGLGLSINFHENFAVRGEWERFNGDGDIDYFSVSAVVKF